MKTCCIIFSDNVKYSKLHKCAVTSFLKFNPEITLFSIDHLGCRLEIPGLVAGIKKFGIAYKLAIENGFEKVIVLGADTIVCSRLDEFLDVDNFDILASLDYPYKIPLNIKFANSHNHVNADVVCFNNLDALKDVIIVSGKNHIVSNYYEQGALNYVLFSGDYKYTYKIVDSPYPQRGISYNCRGKGNICSLTGPSDFIEFINSYRVVDNKLFTSDGCQVKVFHYCQGFGNLSLINFENTVNFFIEKLFNHETKEFFKYNLSTNFFHEKFKI